MRVREIFLFIFTFLGATLALANFNVLMMKKPAIVTYPTVPMGVQFKSTAASSHTLASNNVAGNFLVVICTSTVNGTTLSASDTRGNTYTSAATRGRAGVGTVSLFYAANISAGANTITCASTGGGLYSIMTTEYSGVTSVSPIDNTATASGNSGSSSVALITTQARSLIVKYTFPGAGYVNDFDLNAFSRIDSVSSGYYEKISPTATSNTIVNTLDSARNWVSVMVAFKNDGTSYSNKGIYKIGGMYYGAYLNWVLKSNDSGLNWTRVGTLPVGIEDPCVVSHKNAMFVIGGYASTGSVVSTVYKSTDGGLQWSSVGNLPAVRDGLACVSYNGKIFAMGGSNDDTNSGAVTTVYSSPDGVTWTTAGNLAAPKMHITATVFNNKIWIAGGADTTNQATSYVATSTDGATWTTTGAAALPSARAAGNLITHNNKIWYLNGVNTAPIAQTTVYSCDDPCVTWTTNTATPNQNNDGAAVSINGNMVIVSGVGVDRTFISTNNGSSWGTGAIWPPAAFSGYFGWSRAIVGP